MYVMDLDTSVNAMQVMKLTTGAVLMWMNAYRTFVAKGTKCINTLLK